jgi:electron transfer flavoprotein alpha subunit
MKKKDVNNNPGRVWVFGDYREYFQNRITLQLIAKGKDLAKKLDTGVTVTLLGEEIQQYAMEYVAHGADSVIAADHSNLKEYEVEAYTAVLAEWVKAYQPEIFLAGATSFGREFFPRLAKRLHTGLSADCVDLEIDPETSLLVQTTPSFGGELLAEVITPDRRPQMATVHPGIFRELPHNSEAVGRIIYPDADVFQEPRVKVMRSRPRSKGVISLEDAPIVIAGGMGLGSKEQFALLNELAELLEGEVGATRPAILSGWADEDRLLGQTGKSVKAKLVVSIGTSGALQYTTGIQGAETVIAINRDPHAPIFRIADLGLVADGKVVLPLLLEALRRRI